MDIEQEESRRLAGTAVNALNIPSNTYIVYNQKKTD